jgi:predicted alpha/beta-hydrolase family hydrolase
VKTYASSRPDAPVLVLAPGAGAGENHAWMRKTAQGLADRGISVVTFDFPYRIAGRRLPDRGPVLEAAYRTAWSEIAAAWPAGTSMCIGGKSMGGRIATQVTALGDLSPAPARVVCFGYPLHPPGRPAQRRDQHLPKVAVPMLFVQGSRDPFGSPEEMTELVGWLPRATLSIVEGGDHSLAVPARQDPTGAALSHALDRVAGWVRDGRV